MTKPQLPRLDGQVPFSERSSLPEASCVYFVFDDNSLYYIGRTKNLFSRFAWHSRHPQFTELGKDLTIGWIEEISESLNELEINFIDKLNPVLNGTTPPQIGDSVSRGISMPGWLWDVLQERSKIEDRPVSRVVQRAVKYYIETTTVATWLGTASDGQELAELMEKMSQIEKGESNE